MQIGSETDILRLIPSTTSSRKEQGTVTGKAIRSPENQKGRTLFQPFPNRENSAEFTSNGKCAKFY